MKLSVIIPCYNAEPFLATQLEALAGQRWEDAWEVVLADNGSTDGSMAVAAGFRDRLPELRIVDASDRRGQAHARNVAARAATGEALVFCDADDEVGQGWLEAMGRALERHDFVACRFDIDRLNPPWIRRAHENPQRDGLNRYVYPPFLDHAGGGSLGVRRELFLTLDGFDESMPPLEDTDFCWRAQLAGHELHFVPDAVAHIRYRPSLEGMFRQAMTYGAFNVKIYKRYRDRGMPRLPWHAGLLKWAKLLASSPRLLLPASRVRWLWLLGWRVGRIRGCLRHRVFAP